MVTMIIRATIIACEMNRAAQSIKMKPTRMITIVRYSATIAELLTPDTATPVTEGIRNKSITNIAMMPPIPIEVIVDNKH